MSTIADVLKQEIARVARKELKGEIAAVRKLTSAHRSEIAALKRDVKALTGRVKGLQKGLSRPVASRHSDPEEVPARRRGVPFEFNAEQLAAHRAALGLTQAQMARLIGASSLSVYKWESGKVQPRAAQKAQIAAALKLGKRAVKAKLQELDA